MQHDCTAADRWAKLGNAYERLERWQQAGDAYGKALERNNHHVPSYYYRLGYVLTQAGRHREACEAFKGFTKYPRPEGVTESSYAKTEHQKLISQYLSLRETCPIAEDVVLYESWQGKKLGCNPYALFLYLVREPSYQRLTHVLIVNDDSKFPDWIRKLPNVVLVKRNSYLYIRYLASAKHLVNNTAFPLFFIRRDEQKYLITWHGTPQKVLGKHEKSPEFKRINPAKNLNHATHLISPNAFSTRKIIEGYDVLSSHTAKVAETGYPRIDLTLHADKSSLRRALGIGDKEFVVLYAPTWRGEFYAAQIGGQEGHLLECILKLEARILFRGHHLTQGLFEKMNLPNVVIPSEAYDTNELLAIADALVTDYSSVYFDYLVRRRPIIHYVYDLESYQNDRGLYFGPEEMPGDICFDADSVVEKLREVIKAGRSFVPSERYEAAVKKFVYNEDGHASAKVAAFFFDDANEHVVQLLEPSKKSILIFSGPLKRNGITKSLESLLQNVDLDAYDITIAIDRDRVYAADDGLEVLTRLQMSFTVLGWERGLPQTLSQRYLHGQPKRSVEVFGADAKQEWADSMRMDFRRSFGFKKWNVGINFGGYSPYWSALFAHSDLIERKVIYLHNDILKEHKEKYPDLAGVLDTLRFYDSCVCVSESLKVAMLPSLTKTYGVDAAKVHHVDNFVDFEEMKRRAVEGVAADDEELVRRNGFKYISIGRLSPEKNHATLIEAFRRVLSVRPDSVLLLLGDGPLQLQLEEQIKRLGLRRHAFVLGYRDNPYPYVQASDCMALVSNYEGQGLVLLEALALGKRCMATNVPGPQSVLAGNRGLLVENNLEAIVNGMVRMQDRDLSFSPFSPEAYTKRSLEGFYSRVCGEVGEHVCARRS